MTEKANIGALTIDLLLENKQFKAGIKSAEADTKALGENLKRYGTFAFPIDTPMKKMVEVMKEANRKAKLEGQAFGRTLDSMAAKMKAMTMSGGIISPLKVSPLKRQFIELGDTIKTKFSMALTFAGSAVSKFASGARSILNGLKNFIFNWKTLIAGAIAGAFAAAVIRKAVQGLKTLVSGVIEASSTYEQLRMTLKVLLKDQDKANAAFDEARKLAASTAFSIEEITRGYAQMLTFGFDQTKIPETLLLAADAATAFGQNLDEVIRALSYLKAGRKGEALESLARFGVARTELIKRGAVFSAGGELETDTEKTLQIIFDIFKDKVGGMSKEGQKTWKGMVSNLKDAWTDFMARIGEAGFFDTIRLKLKGILDLIALWAENGQLQEWADRISTSMSRALNGVWFIIKSITGLGESEGTQNTGRIPPWASTVLEWINKIKDKITKLWESFTVGIDKRGSRDQHGIVSGLEGLSQTLATAIGTAIGKIDWGDIAQRIASHADAFVSAGERIGGAIGRGIENSIEKDHPIVYWLFKGGGAVTDIMLAPVKYSQLAYDAFGGRMPSK